MTTLCPDCKAKDAHIAELQLERHKAHQRYNRGIETCHDLSAKLELAEKQRDGVTVRCRELEKLLAEAVPFLRKVPHWLDQDSHETIGPDFVTPREQEKARSLLARIEKGRE